MRHRIGALQEFSVGTWRVVKVEHHEIGVFNSGTELKAVRNRCPHAGARLCQMPLDGTWLPTEPGQQQFGLEGQVLRCPWHGWEFDICTGEMLFGTGNRKVNVYPIVVENGEVFIELQKRSEEN